MSQILPGMQKPSWIHHIGKGVAVAASTGAAIISIFSALYTYGMIGNREAHESIGNLGAAWVRLSPTIDSAAAIGDTVHFAATIADKSGSVLIGAHPTWTTGDSTIASVGTDGAVVARSPGTTTVNAIVGSLIAHSSIVVKPKVAGVVVSSAAGDTAANILEGTELQLRARAVDARGHTVVQAGAAWHADDTTVVALDARGVLTGRNAGRTVVSAKIAGTAGYLPVAVATTATALTIVSGADQRALAGRSLPQHIVVRATNRRGGSAPNKLVTFRLKDAQGKVEPATITTDQDGRARTAWTLADFPGRQTLLATVENVDSTVTILAEADPVPANTRLVALNANLRGRAGQLVVDTVGVRVTDSTGRVLPDVPVRWTTTDGVAQPIAPRTDSLGVARARWTLGTNTGLQRLRALVGSSSSHDLPPLTLTAMSLAGEPAAVLVVSGNKQTAHVVSSLPKPIVLRAVDANGNGASDVTLLLSLSGGSVRDTAMRTDSAGFARTRWALGRSAGDYTLAAHVDGIKDLVKLTAHATPDKAANLSFEDAPSHDKPARTRVRRLSGIVTDMYGNPVPDVPVTFSVNSGSISPARAATDAKGRVALRWMLAAKTGDQTLRGAVRKTDVKGIYVTQSQNAEGTKHKKTSR